MKGVILAAGKGSRMKELTEDKPKVLLEVDGRSSLEHIISGMKKAGIDDIVIVIGYKGEMIKEKLGRGSELGVKITYVEQDLNKYGTGYALSLVKPYIENSFMLSYGDIILAENNYLNLYEKYKYCNYLYNQELKNNEKLNSNEQYSDLSKDNENFSSASKDFEESAEQDVEFRNLKSNKNIEAVISLNWVEDPSSGGAVYLNKEGLVKKIVEKPEAGTSTTNWNSAGLFIFSPLIFNFIEKIRKSERGEYELPSAVNLMLEEGINIASLKIKSYWQDLAEPDDYERINEELS